MKLQNRKKFIITSSLLSLSFFASALVPKGLKEKQIIHYVFFWLKNPSSKEDLNKLINGLRTLRKIETVRNIHIGIPALTELRPVVDNSYSASLLVFFDDLKGEKIYQNHEIHQKFIKECSPLWEKIIVYDTMDV
jgi:hypothetical protein